MRPLIALVGFVGAIFFSPWVPLICMFVLAFRYRAWEVMVLGLLIDLLWRPADAMFHLPLFMLLSIVIVWALEPVRAQLLR